jgi:hypothetical protein
MFYRINLSASAVNDEILQIERRDVKGPKLLWNRAANASVPAAHYVLDLGTGNLFVSFDKFEYEGRTFAGAACDAPIGCSRSPFKARETSRVIAGLDPAIHLLRKTLAKGDGYAGQARV